MSVSAISPSPLVMLPDTPKPELKTAGDEDESSMSVQAAPPAGQGQHVDKSV